MSDDRSFQDGWGPSSFDPFEWRPGDRDYDDKQHQQRREQPENNRPNLFRRWIDRIRAMGTAREWAGDFGALVILCGLIAAFFAFATLFS